MKNGFYGFLIALLAISSYALALPPDPGKDYIQVEYVYASDILADAQSTYSVFIFNPQGIVAKNVKTCYIYNVLDSTRADLASFTNYAEKWQINKQHSGHDKRPSNLAYSALSTIIIDDSEQETNSQLFKDLCDPGSCTLKYRESSRLRSN